MRRGLLVLGLLLALAATARAAPPDRRLLAYTAPDGIHLVRADGTGDRLLPASTPDDAYPQWSPDGKRLVVFTNDGLFVLGLDGSRRRLTRDRGWTDDYPAWSSDGSMIWFDRTRNDTTHVCGIFLRGGPAQLGPEGYYPAFAPTGAYAYTSPNATLLVRSAPNGSFHELDTLGDAWAPVWWPNGDALVFETDAGHPHRGNYAPWANELHTIHADGSGEVALTDNRVYDGDAAVSPDGRTIAFASDRYGWEEVLLMDSDGSHVRRLTYELHGDAYGPAWRPVP